MQREYPSAPIAGVGAVVFHQGNVLLVRRGREPLKGQWSLPGGAVELGETLEEAIFREVWEETGISVAAMSLLTAVDRIERDGKGLVRYHYVLADFLCGVVGGASEAPLRAASDAADCRWVPMKEALQSENYALAPLTKDVIRMGWQAANRNAEI